ncbi:hypothetical protein BpHYR1_042920 [Brachionus plicatilis]|uniref:Uncharacterized protein n=1 Tax=Brachionus plicatilis TaxID=10195 RepID=A0A3M7QEL5_BRAPC|nr:hypothetical protein BpHYR1_042920 [Brachionus plicatilis]
MVGPISSKSTFSEKANKKYHKRNTVKPDTIIKEYYSIIFIVKIIGQVSMEIRQRPFITAFCCIFRRQTKTNFINKFSKPTKNLYKFLTKYKEFRIYIILICISDKNKCSISE